MANARQNKDFIEAIMPAWPLDEAISWISRNMSPEDVFSEKDLAEWADDMGYVMDR